MAKVLVVEDDAAMLDLVVEELSDRGYTVTGVPGRAEAEAILEIGDVDVLITDLNLARGSGLWLCRRGIELDPLLPVIIITAFGSMQAAIEAIRAGAYDFLTKPIGMDALALAVGRAAKVRAMQRELADLRVRVRRSDRSSPLVGASREVTQLRERIAMVATTDATIVVLGESGSGKEIVAREIHALSRRADSAFVAENVAAIPAELLESTLFGHVRGAFTGATGSREGLFRMADGGTLLLDEIGELPLALQPKLLRVLEEGVVRPVGSDVEHKVDVRLLAATHRDLEQLASAGKFRHDLYYRLAVIELDVAPLRERGGDVLLLAQLFLDGHSAQMKRAPFTLHREVAARLLAWHWPGNVRELRNAMQRAAAMARGTLILPADLPPRMLARPLVVPSERRATPVETLAEVERHHILKVFRSAGGNKAEAARLLGIGRKTLYRRLESWGIDVGQTDPSDVE